MPDPIDELKLAAVRKAYLSREGSTAQLAKRFGISEGTIKRYKKSGDWDALRKGKEQVVRAVLCTAQQTQFDRPPNNRVEVAGASLDFEELLATAITSLATDVATLPGKSRESAAMALTRLIETYRKYHPPTIDEFIDLALSIPGFSPEAFAKRLRERIESA